MGARPRPRPLLVWIDIENPPQVQYLLPFVDGFAAAGAETVVTARDYGITYDLLGERGAEFHPVGASYGAAKARKVLGVAARTRALVSFFRGREKPGCLVCAGRAALLAARLLRVPAFSIWDYEHADLTFDRLGRSFVVHPDSIPAEAFVRKGIAPGQLLAFRGLKEDLSFAGLDLDALPAHEFGEIGDHGLTRILVRPAAEESHYYRAESGAMTSLLLDRLAARDDALVIFSPRYPHQADELRRHAWTNEPVILRDAIPFVSLLKAVDAVVTSGGTMAREAAYLGVPSYSVFQGKPGGVDLYLQQLGRMRLIARPDELVEIAPAKAVGLNVLESNPHLLGDLVARFAEIASRGRSL